ncbi:MAG: hypothetical protein K0Q58_673, partial [Microbacterium sp.]|nr:hypothetical protein [Microbacterium sp.]
MSRSSGTYPIPALTPSAMDRMLRREPSIVTVPASAGATPKMASAISVRPEPSRPVIPRISP